MRTQEWTKINYNFLKQHPCARWGHASFVSNSKLYIMGGYADIFSIDQQYMNDLWEFDFQKIEWKKIEIVTSNLPEPRSNHTMHLFDSFIYLYGGGGQSRARYGDLWKLDINQKNWKKIACGGQIPTPRTYHSSCVEDGKLFIYGGECVEDLDSFVAVDLRTQNYLNILHSSERPQTRRFSSLSSVKIKNEPFLVLLGGCSPSYTPSPQIYLAKMSEISENQLQITWVKLKDHFYRWGHSAQIYKNSLWIFGGRNKEDLTDLVEIKLTETFQAEIKTWNQSSQIKSRRKHTACLIGNSMVVFGGFNGEYHSDLQFIELTNDFFPNEIENHQNFKQYLLYQKELSDLIFYSFDKKEQLMVHKFILLNFMQQIHTQSPIAEQVVQIYSSNEIILQKDINFNNFRAFIRFVYNDTILSEDIQYFEEIKVIIQKLFDLELEESFFFQSNQSSNQQAMTILSKYLMVQDNNAPNYVLKCRQAIDEDTLFSLVKPWVFYRNVNFVTEDNFVFQANKAIFCCQSGFFQEMFTQNFLESKQEVIHLKNIVSEDFKIIYIFLYTGMIVFNQNHDALSLFRLMELAIYLDIQKLCDFYSKQKLIRLISKQITSFNLLDIYQKSIELGISKLQEVCAYLVIDLNNGLTEFPLNDSTNSQQKSESGIMKEQINEIKKERTLYLMFKSRKPKMGSSSKKENKRWKG